MFGFVTSAGTGIGDDYFRFNLNSAAPLTDSGGTVTVTAEVLGQCSVSGCTSFSSNLTGYTGSLVGTSAAAPEPAALSLVSSGMLALFGLAIRRRRS